MTRRPDRPGHDGMTGTYTYWPVGTFPRVTVPELAIAHAPDRPFPLTVLSSMRMERSVDRYWLVGLHVITEDTAGWTWVTSRDELRTLDARAVVREVKPDDRLPRCLARIVHRDGTPATFDSLLVTIRETFDLLSRVGLNA